MRNKEDLRAAEWAYGVFQRCVPEKFRESIAVRVGMYSDMHPSQEIVKKIVKLHDDWLFLTSRHDKSVEGVDVLTYIKKQW